MRHTVSSRPDMSCRDASKRALTKANERSTLLSFSVLRGRTEPALVHDARLYPISVALSEQPAPISPLFSPHGDLSQISKHCSRGTYDIVLDMHNLTQALIAYRGSASNDYLTTHIQLIYSRLVLHASTADQASPDWVYESCRLAALIYCRSIMYRCTLAMSASGIHSQIVGSGTSSTLHMALLHALERTDKQDCWGPLRGVLLWICVIGGAASWPGRGGVEAAAAPVSAWARKYFAVHMLRTLASVGIEHGHVAVQALQTGLYVRNWLDAERRQASSNAMFRG
jgi:hypothetical protein